MYKVIVWMFLLTRVIEGKNLENTRNELYKNLLKNYNKHVLPIGNEFSEEYLNVHVDLVLVGLENVDERHEVIKISYWFLLQWYDKFLVWNSTDYGGVNKIHLPTNDIWIPDIVPHSVIKMEGVPEKDQVSCSLTNNGTVSCSFNEVIEVHCPMQVFTFPFDKQNCTVVYYSWSYGGRLFRLHSPSPNGSLAYYRNNTEWELVSFTNAPYVKMYISGPWYEMHYYLIIKRKPYYYIYTILVPSFLITTLALVGLFSPFNAHGEREERVSMGLTTLLTMSVLLLVISGQMPKTSDGIPLMGAYILFEIAMSSFATCETVWVMHLHRSSLRGDVVPDWLYKLTMTTYNQKINEETKIGSFSIPKNGGGNENTDGLKNLTLVMEHCLKNVTNMRKELETRTKMMENVDCWRKVCDRLDSMLMILFLVIHIIVTLTFLLFPN